LLAGTTRLGILVLAVAGAAAPPDKPSFNRHTGLFEPPFSELERAVDKGDRAELARWAARIGPARIGEALRGSDRARVLAALDAVTLLPGGVRLLEAATPLLASSDGATAERAARAVGQMLDSSEPRRLDDWDVPVDAVGRACNALAQTATRAEAAAPVRLAALDALAEASVCRSAPVATLAFDGSAEIRRAAFLALRPRDDLPGAALRQAAGDKDPAVASAAAVAVCRRRRAGVKASDGEPALRTVALAESTPVEDAVEILSCLASSSDSGDKQALEQLKRAKAPALRARATELAPAKAP
jgi:hypothetical protein